MSYKGARYFAVLLVALLFAITTGYSQGETTVRDSLSHNIHSPKKATIYSAIIPGLGQVYNKKYWKIPLIYGGIGVAAYYFNYNQIRYQKILDYLKSDVTQDQYEVYGRLYDQATLPRARDFHRRNRDLSIFSFAGVYIINILDAMVDAYLFEYDVSDDLSLKINPAYIQTDMFSGTLGLVINVRF